MKSNRDLDNRYGTQGYSKYGKGYQEDKHKVQEAIKQKAKETGNASHLGVYRTPKEAKQHEEEKAKELEEFLKEEGEELRIRSTKLKETLKKALLNSTVLKNKFDMYEEGCDLATYYPKKFFSKTERETGLYLAEHNLKYAMLFGYEHAATHLISVYNLILPEQKFKIMERLLLKIGSEVGDYRCKGQLEKEEGAIRFDQAQKSLVSRGFASITNALLKTNNGEVAPEMLEGFDSAVLKCIKLIKSNGLKYRYDEITPERMLEALTAYNDGLAPEFQLMDDSNYYQALELPTPMMATPIKDIPQTPTQESVTKTTEIKNDSIVYGVMTEKMVETPNHYKANGQKITIEKYRTLTLPDYLKPGQEFIMSFPVNTPSGERIGVIDPAYLTVTYNNSGKLVKLSLPNKPVVDQTDSGPVLMLFKGNVYTLPITTAHYLHLTDLVRANNGTVERGTIDVPLSVEFANLGVDNKHHAPLPTSAMDLPHHNMGKAPKITEIKIEGTIYGIMSEVMVEKPYNYKVNGYKVTIEKYRDITLPTTLKPGTDVVLNFPLRCPDGEAMSAIDAAFLQVKYNDNGKLVKLSVPSKPAISEDSHAPVLIRYKENIYTLPINSGHYLHLTDIVRSNDGVVDRGPLDSTPFDVTLVGDNSNCLVS